MSNLPECRWRHSLNVIPSRAGCSSPFIATRNDGTVPLTFCGECPYCDRTTRLGPGPAHVALPYSRTRPCVHRGPELRRQTCDSCKGAWQIKVFRCELHGECTAELAVGVRVCRTCDDYRTPARAVVINLDRRPERLDRFLAHAPKMEPLLASYERFAAIDGWQAEVPRLWRGGRGAWGCRQSHLQVLADALRDGVELLSVFEDDCVFAPNFAERFRAFLDSVPKDWEGLMLGCQQQTDAPSVCPGVRRVYYAQRTHAYVVRGKKALEELHALWSRTTTHIDHYFGEWQKSHNVFCPDPLLCGQGAGPSDISRRNDPERYWQ